MLVGPYFGDAFLLVFTAAMVVGAAVLQPSPDVVSVFGYDVPILCGFRRLTGYACPGCGLTRSFAFMAHGQLWQALDANWFGPPFFLFVAGQVPWRAWTMARTWQRRARRSAPAA